MRDVSQASLCGEQGDGRINDDVLPRSRPRRGFPLLAAHQGPHPTCSIVGHQEDT